MKHTLWSKFLSSIAYYLYIGTFLLDIYEAILLDYFWVRLERVTEALARY